MRTTTESSEKTVVGDGRRLLWISVLLLAAGTICSPLFGQQGRGKPDDWFIARTPPATQKPPKMISSAETIMILPGPPACPMSQTERKRPPSPDYLMGKVIWGQSASFKNAQSLPIKIDDWNLADRDLISLTTMIRPLGFSYHWSHTRLDQFDYDPKRLPCLLISGVRELKFPADQIKKLREYVLGGGMIVCDSVYGSPHFYESALRVFDTMFPESKFRVIPQDHPLYHIQVDLDKAAYACGAKQDKPFLEGLYVGSRIGVLVSRYGLGCGWEGEMGVFADLVARGLAPAAYAPQTAKAIALNLAAYIIGYARAGEIEGSPELFGLPDQKTPTSEFVFAQIKHDGSWNTHPGAARALLTKLKHESTIPVNLRRVAVDPAQDDLSPYPFLYLTGLDDFSLTPKAVEKLRDFVRNGGTLFVNNSLGLSTFDRAARREIARILPENPLQAVLPTHPIFRSLQRIGKVQYTATLQKDKGKELDGRVVLEGIAFGNDLRVIYSPYDIEAGWNDVYYPLLRGYDNASAKQLGMNVIAYSMTH